MYSPPRHVCGGYLVEKIAKSMQLKNKDVSRVIGELIAIATEEVTAGRHLIIPQILTLKLKQRPARKADTQVIFGKTVKAAAKPAPAPPRFRALRSEDRQVPAINLDSL